MPELSTEEVLRLVRTKEVAIEVYDNAIAVGDGCYEIDAKTYAKLKKAVVG